MKRVHTVLFQKLDETVEVSPLVTNSPEIVRTELADQVRRGLYLGFMIFTDRDPRDKAFRLHQEGAIECV